MRLASRDGSRLPLERAVLLSAGWGTGVAAGVALGSVITAASGAGAPGASSSFTPDLVALPLTAGVGVFLVHFASTLVLGSVRARRARERVPGPGEQDERE